ncbi:hypothetical protein [Hyphobacterium sp.]|uniref:hypothetical protein n=1 Tax=Hyphobacterium sp. TaxID=2004662 RepID=UPI003BAB36FB
MTPTLPGGFEDEQSWFDERVASGATDQNAPPVIPDKSPALSASEIEQASQAVLRVRDALLQEERASQPPVSDTENFANQARERAEPPDPID